MSIDAFVRSVFAALLAQETHDAIADIPPSIVGGGKFGSELLEATARACSRLIALVTDGEIAQLMSSLSVAVPTPKLERIASSDIAYLADFIWLPIQERGRTPPELLPQADVDHLRAELRRTLAARRELCVLIEAFLHMEHSALRSAVETWRCAELEASLRPLVN